VGGVPVPASDPNSNPAAGGQKPALDFSSVGGKPVVGQDTNTDKQDDPSFMDRAKQFVSDIPTGIGKGVAETAGTIAHGINRVTGLPMNQEFLDQEKQTGATSPGEMAGKGIEGLMEYFGGDEILKSASLAKRLGLAAKVADLAETHPAISKLIEAGLNVVRGAGVSAGQSAVHAAPGQTASDAEKGAAYGAVGSTLGEILGPVSEWLGNKTPEAIESAASKKYATETLKKNLRQNAIQGEAAEIFDSTAKQAADKVLSKFGKTAGSSLSKAPELYTFGDAAQEIKNAAQPTFKSLDAESGGGFQMAKNAADKATTALRRATTVEDLTKAESALAHANSDMDQVFANSKVDPKELRNARDAWRQASALEQVHAKLDSAFDLPKNAADILSDGNKTEIVREIDPKKYLTQLNASFRKPALKRALEETLGREGVQNLYDISDRFAEAAASEDAIKGLHAAIQKEMQEQGVSKVAKHPLSILGTSLLSPIAAHSVGLSGIWGLPVATMHYLFTHPEAGTKVFGAASKAAPILAQGAKQAAQQGVTHTYNPETEEAEPVK